MNLLSRDPDADPDSLARTCSIAGVWKLVRVALMGALIGFAFSAAPHTHAADALAIESMGIGGHYRVGKWIGIRLNGDATTGVQIQTRDGDGVRVQFSSGDAVSQATAPSPWIYVIPGSEAAPIVLLRDNETVASSRLPTSGSASRGPAMIAADTPLIQIFGDALGIDRIGENEILRRDATVATVIPTDADQLPDSWRGYDAVDIMVVTKSGQSLLSQMSVLQQQAVIDWVHSGGQIFLALGKSAPQLLGAATWLKPLLPFEATTTVDINPSALETATSSQTPLNTFTGIKLPRNVGRSLITGRTTRRTSTPIASEFRYGFGRVVVLAADLEDEPFSDWPERMDLLTKLVGEDLLPPDPRDEVSSRLTAYNDLSGQLRNSLDRFSLKNTSGFSTIALILMGLIAVIGPLDYLLVNRLLGRPVLGWLSFPIAIAGISTLLAFGATPNRSAANLSPDNSASLMQCNRLEIVDIDAATGRGRGESFNFIYAHQATLLDIDFEFASQLSGIAEDVHNFAGPFGFPGQAFGGIQIAIEDTRLPTYQTTSTLGLDSNKLIQELPLAPRSSKGVFHHFDFATSVAESLTLTQRSGSELLQGELINPLPYDIHGGMLIYRNWVYLLPTRFPAGGRVASIDLLRQKNFRWLLSRKIAIELASQSEAWDPGATEDLNRLAEILMFHESVGGTQYTKLKHGPLEHLDLTESLSNDRCILMGQVKEGFTKVLVDEPSGSLNPQGNSLSMIRLILPVVPVD